MSYYRLYFLNGSRIVKAEELHADDDLAAMRLAKSQAGTQRVELWCGARKIGEVHPDDLASSQKCTDFQQARTSSR
jgi:hypothetical protein